MGDDPIGEGVPKGSFAEGEADLLDEDKESPGPQCDAMDFTRGPIVVDDEEEQEALSEQGVDANLPSAEGDRYARDGSDHQGGAGEIDVAFMCGGVPSVAEGEKEECGEEEHVGQRNDIESSGVTAKGIQMASLTQQQIRARKDANNDHQTAERESSESEAAMNIRTSGGDERGLANQQKDPGSECRTVNVNDQAGQWRAENSSKEISACKTGHHGKEHEQSAGGEKVMVVTVAGKARRRTRRCNRLSGDSCQSTSVIALEPNTWELREIVYGIELTRTWNE